VPGQAAGQRGQHIQELLLQQQVHLLWCSSMAHRRCVLWSILMQGTPACPYSCCRTPQPAHGDAGRPSLPILVQDPSACSGVLLVSKGTARQEHDAQHTHL
jgi:hypothetical protein